MKCESYIPVRGDEKRAVLICPCLSTRMVPGTGKPLTTGTPSSTSSPSHAMSEITGILHTGNTVLKCHHFLVYISGTDTLR